MKSIFKQLLLHCALWMACGAWAQPLDLSGAALLLEDPGGAMTVQQAAAQAARFAPGKVSVGFTTSAYWMRFTVRNSGREPATWWLDTSNRTLQEVDLYQSDGKGGYLHGSAGAGRPFSQRPLATDYFVFPVTVAAGGTAELYLRVRSTGFQGVMMKPLMWTPSAYQARAQSERTQWLLYLGMAATLAGFNLMLWLYLREHDHLVYVLSLLAIIWTTSSAAGGYGSAFQMLWPDAPRFEQCSWVLSLLAVCVLTPLFISRLLDLWRRMPRVSMVLWGLIGINCVTSLILAGMTALGVRGHAEEMQLVYIVGGLLWQPIFPLLGYAIVKCALRGDRFARFMLVAYLPAIAASTYTSLQNVRGEPPSLVYVMWGAGFELLVMALALADRFNQERLQKLAAQEALLDNLRRSEQELEQKVTQRTLELNAEQKRTKELLYNILPVELAEELSSTGQAQPARHESATVLFTDFAGFTAVAATMPADRMISELNEIFAAFDDITDECGVEKIKTIGDSYMAAAGLPKPCADHAQRCVRAGLRMIAFIEERNSKAPFKWTLRVGIHSGPVVAGVVGKRKYAFDIWGDTVNIASRMESSGAVGRVNVSAYTSDLARDDFDCEYRGKVAAKGKGEMDMYFITGERAAGAV
ncbi:adenylate/guanylate cyclase domain-containing protein [Pseudoduganella namucuonensis]|uniref:Adenylate cyclase, class 3 n=1 Tax=Pseudoduganella namucuonensis TaxID=1035707 RepID=A0A1I7L2H4_9BURK|nr:adenylate/guanylate cyclase domain-containing protein [Pseudoduganella namucuonensis]SFV03887.1 Adenylate cyclase, class 3 [Pseudoduganella namucuonensis]